MPAEIREYLIRNIVVNAYQINHEIEMEVTTSKQIAKPGDWVVIHKNGKTKIVSAERFSKEYMPLRG
jgi:hypothetical protein